MSTGATFNDWCIAVRNTAASRAAHSLLEERERAELLMGLIKYKDAYGTMAQWEAAYQDVAAILGFTGERMAGILSLTDLGELRRALRVMKREPYKRFPDEMIYPTDGWFGEYLELHAGMEVPLGWHFWSAVAIVGAMCQRNYLFDCGSFWIVPNQYVMLVGPTGEKKSTAISQAENLLQQANGLLQEWGDAQSPPKAPQLYVKIGRGSPEGFSDKIAIREDLALHRITAEPYERGRTHSCALIVNDEVVSILGRGQPGSDRWIDLLTALYTRKDWDEDLRGSKMRYYRNIAVSALLGSTVDWLRDVCTPSSFAGGWMARVVYVERETSNRVFPNADIVDPVAAHGLARELHELGIPKNEEMRFSRAAYDFHDAWYRENHKHKAGSWVMQGWYNRKDSHLRKLCMVLALMDRPRTHTIEVRHIELALKLFSIEEQRMPRAFMNVVAKEPAVALDRMISTLRKAPGFEMKRSDLMRSCYRVIGDKRQLDMLIETGVATGYFELRTVATGGRPGIIVKLVRDTDDL